VVSVHVQYVTLPRLATAFVSISGVSTLTRCVAVRDSMKLCVAMCGRAMHWVAKAFVSSAAVRCSMK